MKILLLFIYCNCSLMTFFGHSRNGISTLGIYIKATDYESSILPVQKVVLNHLFSSPYITVWQSGRKIRMNKDSIFGYRDEEGRSYRFFKNYNDEYQIIENRGIVVYSLQRPIYNSKGISMQYTHLYFFSRGLSGYVYPLTINNLKDQFQENETFVKLLSTSFSCNEPIYTYSTERKIFKINDLLDKSLKQ
jgi:hypothetical protein